MIVGNDISNFQGDVNYDIYSKNANFVIIKATEGTGFIDVKFRRNQSEARRTGLLLGSYHFARPDLGNKAENEADYFLSVIGALREGEVVALDYEVSWNGPTVSWCKAFLDRVLFKTGIKALIYLNKSQVDSYDWQPIIDAGYGLWIAYYQDLPYSGKWPFAALQQWTSSQKVPGIIGNVDGNYFFGDREQFKKYGLKLNKPSESPSVSPSSSLSPSPSRSLSASASSSMSASVSPSPSAEIPDPKYGKLKAIIESNWNWVGKNGWKKKLQQLRDIIYA